MLSASKSIRHVSRRAIIRRTFATNSGAAPQSSSSSSAWMSAAAVATFAFAVSSHQESKKTFLLSRVPTGGDVLMVGAPVKEKATGILFPQLCNGYNLVGCGVRVKWGLIKVYAVGTYMDPIAMSGIKSQPTQVIEKALLNPMYPRTIRIVMNRGLSIEKYTAAIVEALEPRMNGEDLEFLEAFKKLNPPVDLVEGAEIEMTIRGDTLLYRNAVGGVGAIHSSVFTRALCDVYYGVDPVSPTHKQAVLDGIPKM